MNSSVSEKITYRIYAELSFVTRMVTSQLFLRDAPTNILIGARAQEGLLIGHGKVTIHYCSLQGLSIETTNAPLRSLR